MTSKTMSTQYRSQSRSVPRTFTLAPLLGAVTVREIRVTFGRACPYPSLSNKVSIPYLATQGHRAGLLLAIRSQFGSIYYKQDRALQNFFGMQGSLSQSFCSRLFLAGKKERRCWTPRNRVSAPLVTIATEGHQAGVLERADRLPKVDVRGQNGNGLASRKPCRPKTFVPDYCQNSKPGFFSHGRQ